MGGWRDENGRTATDRKKTKAEADLARFASDVRHRPLTLLQGLAGFIFVTALVFALIRIL